MAAGMGHQCAMVAGGAGELHLRAGLGAAVFDRRQRLGVFGSQALPVLRQERRPERVDDPRQGNHVATPQAMVKPSIRVLMRSMAWCLVWSVRGV